MCSLRSGALTWQHQAEIICSTRRYAVRQRQRSRKRRRSNDWRILPTSMPMGMPIRPSRAVTKLAWPSLLSFTPAIASRWSPAPARALNSGANRTRHPCPCSTSTCRSNQVVSYYAYNTLSPSGRHAQAAAPGAAPALSKRLFYRDDL